MGPNIPPPRNDPLGALLGVLGMFGLDILCAVVLIALLCCRDRRIPAKFEWAFPLRGRWLWLLLLTVTVAAHLGTGVGMLYVLRNRP